MAFRKTYDSITPANKALIQTLSRPERLMKILGVTMRDTYGNYLTELGRPYSNMVRPYLVTTPTYNYNSASAVITGQGASIYEHRINGGLVTPKNASYLAIPLTSKAKKWGSPRENRHPGLELTKRGRTWFLKERDYVKRVGKRWKRIVSDLQYVLKKSVLHRPHPEAVVPESRVFQAVQDAVRGFFQQYGQNLGGKK